MKNLEGMQWGELTVEEKEELLAHANCVDGASGNNAEEGDCIVDLTDIYSIPGKIVDDEIIIDNEAIIYDVTK